MLATAIAGFALALTAAPRDTRATPPFAAAAAELPAQARAALLGGAGEQVDALLVDDAGRAQWTCVTRGALAAMRDDAGRVSAGALRAPLLDAATERVGAVSVRAARGLTGRGVVVAVVDTGLDVRHPDVRNADGTTRVAWLLDLSRPPRGAHPELEQRFGIARPDGTRAGAVYSAADLDALLAREARGEATTELPVDPAGHGTFVTSLAAGNGRAGVAPRYVGVAPGATLVVARAAPDGIDRFTDAAIVAGAAFAMDRAAALGQPAVLNLSIGSHHGAHDGSAPLERALAALAPPDARGRAVVVAAGNDGTGAVHARVDLLARAPAEIPVLDVPPGTRAAGDVVVLELVYEGVAQIAVRSPSGGETPWVAPGQVQGYGTDDGVVAVANATDDAALGEVPPALSPRGARPRTASVLIAGDPERGIARRGGTYTVRVAGSGVVHAYVVDGGSGLVRARFAPWVATRDGTVVVPATSPALVAVGATVNRLAWPVSATQDFQLCRAPDDCADLVPGAVAPLSARGPNRVNAPRPDLVAPGMYLIGALSAQATLGARGSVLRADTQRVEGGAHLAAAGTSAAAPLVAGAIALLLEAHPDATFDAVRAALAAGARATAARPERPRWNRDEGWGELDVPGALAVLEGAGAGAVDLARSELVATREHVAPDEPVRVLLRLVGADGRAARDDAVPAGAVLVRADHGRVEGAVRALGGARFEAVWRASGMAPGQVATLRATVAGEALARGTTVRVVREVATGGDGGYVARSGGCAVRGAPAHGRGRYGAGVLGVVALTARRRRAPRRARG